MKKLFFIGCFITSVFIGMRLWGEETKPKPRKLLLDSEVWRGRSESERTLFLQAYGSGQMDIKLKFAPSVITLKEITTSMLLKIHRELDDQEAKCADLMLFALRVHNLIDTLADILTESYWLTAFGTWKEYRDGITEFYEDPVSERLPIDLAIEIVKMKLQGYPRKETESLKIEAYGLYLDQTDVEAMSKLYEVLREYKSKKISK